MTDYAPDTAARFCDDAALASDAWSPETLEAVLLALCADAAAQQARLAELTAALESGAEHARALEAQVNAAEGRAA
jgi:hypothetical protein